MLLSALGFYMWPHLFEASFTAKSGDTLRRNAVIMPLHTISLNQLVLPFAGSPVHNTTIGVRCTNPLTIGFREP